ncbi:glycosyltransferase [Novosphingobium pentaromativorans]|uniref:Colanic acid biosynthesis glycosyltransferase WcaL n=1 Tax=Novosphingobium pentaromativorans US6-1 TaxID=1088721 RepID=G6EKK6_9SPHN|nr:glycosyltransferase [Novosphingobium pentaromativorans]EHJ58162.1 hypothetical protein NSU_4877 [Novosphingobium pentaromativorans US6-1]
MAVRTAAPDGSQLRKTSASVERPPAAGAGTEPKVVYLVRRFPVRSQTFVTNEIIDHIRSGADVRVMVFETPDTADFPLEDLDPLVRPRVTYLDVPRANTARIGEALRLLLRKPGHLPLALRALARARQEGKHATVGTLLFALKLAGTLESADIVHCHFGNVGRMAAMILRLGRWQARLVTTFHGYDVSKQAYQPLGEYYAPLIERGDLLLTVNSIWAERLQAAGADPARIRIHHMGINPAAIEGISPGRPEAETVRFCMVGRMVAKKGHEVALQALALLRRRRPELAVSLVMVGEGPLLESLKAQARADALEDAAAFRGALNHASALAEIGQADAFVLPSRTAPDGDMEGIPVVLMEAMAMGKPVISTRHSGIPELVADGVNGLLADENDPAGIADAMERLAEDAGLRQRLGTSAREAVLAEFNEVTQGERLRRIYVELAGSKP